MYAGRTWGKRNAALLIIGLAVAGAIILCVRMGVSRKSTCVVDGTSRLPLSVHPVGTTILVPADSEPRALGEGPRDGEPAQSVTTPVEQARSIPDILNPTNLIYKNHRALTESQQAIRDYRGTVVSNGVPTNSVEVFEEWAGVLYRDAMTQLAMEPSLSAVDRQELAVLMAADNMATSADVLAKSPLEQPYLDRLLKLISSLPILRTQGINRATALGTADEFGRLAKDRQWESEIHYLTAYEEISDNISIPVAELVAASMPYLDLQDPYLTKAIVGFVSDLPRHRQVTDEDSLLIKKFVEKAREGNPS